MKRNSLVTAISLAVFGLGSSAVPASAETFFNFFGSSAGGSLSKEHVTINARQRAGTIIVSFSDRRLYKMVGKNRAIAYPIAVPRAISRWSGTMRISRKAVNPTWTPTASMRRENPKLPAFVPGGHPRNPLGTRALYLGSSLYRIHGTDAPWTIGKNVSKGCIRMYNSHSEELYATTRVGTRVIVTWKSYNRSYAGQYQEASVKKKRRSRRNVRRSSRRQQGRSFANMTFGQFMAAN